MNAFKTHEWGSAHYQIAGTTSVDGLPFWIMEPQIHVVERFAQSNGAGVIFSDADGDWKSVVEYLRHRCNFRIEAIEAPGPDGKPVVRHFCNSRIGRIVKTGANY